MHRAKEDRRSQYIDNQIKYLEVYFELKASNKTVQVAPHSIKDRLVSLIPFLEVTQIVFDLEANAKARHGFSVFDPENLESTREMSGLLLDAVKELRKLRESQRGMGSKKNLLRIIDLGTEDMIGVINTLVTNAVDLRLLGASRSR